MAIKATQREIREQRAIDITHYNDEQIRELRKQEGYFDEIAWSCGTYGCNGKLLQGNNTKELYKITARTTVLWSI